MAKNAIVYGNGESRKEWDITRKFNDTETWGCNRIEILLGTQKFRILIRKQNISTKR